MQLINRVGWDNALRVPDLNELGWKETIRVNPLQDTIVAIRPYAPTLPFEVPNSYRLIDPTMPEGAVLTGPPGGFVDPSAEPVTVTNHYVNYGWEYVMHCHLLGHEEMDMMHAVIFGVNPWAPSDLTAMLTGTGNKMNAELTWMDNSIAETHYIVERASDPDGPWTQISSFVSPGGATTGVMTYTDSTMNRNVANYYRVIARNVIGDTFVYADPAIGFPQASMDSHPSNVAGAAPAAPSSLSGVLQNGPDIRLTWTDNANNEAGFAVERAVDGGPFAFLATATARSGSGNTKTYTDKAITANHTYDYRVASMSAGGVYSSFTNTATVVVPDVPAAPGNIGAVAARVGNSNNARITLTWSDLSSIETGFTIQWTKDSTYATGLTTRTVNADVTSYLTPNLARTTTFYLRIRSDGIAGSSVWVTVSVTTP